MSTTHTFVGGYGRVGEISIEQAGVCDVCHETAPCIVIDGSEGEYHPGAICQKCADKMYPAKPSTIYAVELHYDCFGHQTVTQSLHQTPEGAKLSAEQYIQMCAGVGVTVPLREKPDTTPLTDAEDEDDDWYPYSRYLLIAKRELLF